MTYSSISIAPAGGSAVRATLRGLKAFFLFWWIVPRVQYDLLDVEYQLYTFEIFHRDYRTKLAHYVTIPAIAFFTMALLAQFAPPGAPLGANGALLYAGLVSALHLGWTIRRGLWQAGAFTAFVLLAMVVPATCFYEATRVTGAPWYAPTPTLANPLLWIYVFAFLETLSHALEPIPPHVSGQDRWQSHAEFWQRGGLFRIAAVAGVPTLHTVVSLVSNLHLVPTMVLRIMFSTGYLPGREDEIRAAVAREIATGNPEIDRFPRKYALQGARAGEAP